MAGNLPGTFLKCRIGFADEPGRAPYHHVADDFKREGFLHFMNDAAESWPQTKWTSWPLNEESVSTVKIFRCSRASRASTRAIRRYFNGNGLRRPRRAIMRRSWGLACGGPFKGAWYAGMIEILSGRIFFAAARRSAAWPRCGGSKLPPKIRKRIGHHSTFLRGLTTTDGKRV